MVDATCPFVKAIHAMADAASQAGRNVIVCGQREHPEVIGTLGWAGDKAFVVGSVQEALALPPMEEAPNWTDAGWKWAAWWPPP